MNNNIDKYFSVAFLAVVTTCGAFSAGGLLLKPEELSAPAVLSGDAAKAIENRYDQQFVCKELGTNAWGALEYALFKEGRQGVVIGDNGWLFTSEEFHNSARPQQAIEQNLDYIQWVNRELADQNIQLLVVPVPSKARLYPQKTGSHRPSAIHHALYPQLIQQLHNTDVSVFDSLAAMEQQTGNSNTPLFLRTDTHWSPEGANQVANHIAADLSDWDVQIPMNTETFVTEKVGEKTHRGDLTQFLPLSPWFDQLLPEMDSLNLYRTYQEQDDLFGDSDNAIRIALVGTSYSANPDWNFDGSLKQSLGVDLANFAEQGNGPLLPMTTFLDKHIHTLPELQLVIWEIPERYLMASYPQAYTAKAKTKPIGTVVAKVKFK